MFDPSLIEIEEEYLKTLGTPEQDSFCLADKLGENELSIDEYQAEKKQFVFEATEHTMIRTGLETVHGDVAEAIRKNEPTIYVIAPTKRWVFSNKDGQEGEDVLFIGHECENVITSSQDLSFAIVTLQHDILHLYYNWLTNELASLGIEGCVTVGVEKRIGIHSVYYFNIFFKLSNVPREAVLAKWCL